MAERERERENIRCGRGSDDCTESRETPKGSRNICELDFICDSLYSAFLFLFLFFFLTFISRIPHSFCSTCVFKYHPDWVHSSRVFVPVFLLLLSFVALPFLFALGCNQQCRLALPMDASSSSMDFGDAPHVLAVDDNLVDRKLIERLLKNSSCRVTTAENGQRALEYLGLGDDQQNNSNGSAKVNLIITDYCMPGMTGYELLKKIKASSLMKEVPVVIMSSENIPTRINRCLEEGAQMFMLKPIKQSDVKKLRCYF